MPRSSQKARIAGYSAELMPRGTGRDSTEVQKLIAHI